MTGQVAIVGAGPGAADLMTLRAVRALERADVVLHDRLVEPEVLGVCRADCRLIDVGKRLGENHAVTQGRILQLLVDLARQGYHVVRLKGGDPFVFGRGGEEIAALKQARIAFQVVPGLSSALAAPALAEIPLTFRGLATGFGVFTARSGKGLPAVDLSRAACMDTAIILMGAGRAALIACELMAAGRAAATPVAVVASASRADQRVWRGTLAQLAECNMGFPAPATIVVGETVNILTQPNQRTHIS